MSTVTVKVPKSRHGAARLRKPGKKKLQLVDTDDDIKAGLNGGCKVPTAPPFKGDYFTEVAETVERTPWVEKMLRRGSLELATPASPPKASGKKPLDAGTPTAI
jgi:hypothetical protein